MSRRPLLPPAPETRLQLPDVTLCAVSSSNLAATVTALRTSMAMIEFADVLLFTHSTAEQLGIDNDDGIRLVPIDRITSSAEYSTFVLEQLAGHIRTSHCLLAQWDGHVIDPSRWRPEFLDYDYVGASWPQFDDGHDVGNGGFSLRSKRLMQACLAEGFDAHHPEDVAICRTNRVMLEAQGLHFADRELADAFSAERASDPSRTFGFHGVFLMPQVLGADRFWQMYEKLDDRGTLWHDTWLLAKSMMAGRHRFSRIVRMLRDRHRHKRRKGRSGR